MFRARYFRPPALLRSLRFRLLCMFLLIVAVTIGVVSLFSTFRTSVTYGKLWESRLSDLRLDSTLSNEQIAQQLGVSVNTIFRQVKKLGLPPRLQMPERERKTPSEVELSFHREQWLKTIADYYSVNLVVLGKDA
ncbi:MAG TPA: TnsD family Tn7-like transposition protein [Ktedonobacteraceae bacterium]